MCDDLDQLTSVARVRGFLNAIFLSDITTADGKLIGQHALSENTEYVRRPSYKFPRESPTKEDRIICKIFLRSLMLENFELPTQHENHYFLLTGFRNGLLMMGKTHYDNSWKTHA